MERNELLAKLIYCVENIELFYKLLTKERYLLDYGNDKK